MSDQDKTEEEISSNETANEQRYQNYILNERGKQYGDALLTHQMIGKIWTGILLAKLKPGMEIEPHEVTVCMDGLKSARLIQNPRLKDSYTDKPGYTELTETIVEQTIGEVNL